MRAILPLIGMASTLGSFVITRKWSARMAEKAAAKELINGAYLTADTIDLAADVDSTVLAVEIEEYLASH